MTSASHPDRGDCPSQTQRPARSLDGFGSATDLERASWRALAGFRGAPCSPCPARAGIVGEGSRRDQEGAEASLRKRDRRGARTEEAETLEFAGSATESSLKAVVPDGAERRKSNHDPLLPPICEPVHRQLRQRRPQGHRKGLL